MSSEPGPTARILRRNGSPDLAYRWLPGAAPAVVFLGGFVSDMTGTKAVALGEYCARRGWACLRLDYSGHGASGGTFAEGSVGRWARDALAVIDAVTAGPLLLVGSSMGAWIAALVCRARPERVAGLVTVAAAPDFTEELLWPALSPAQRESLASGAAVRLVGEEGEGDVEVGPELFADGRRNRVLGGPIPWAGPARLLHGLEDRDVPWQTSMRLAEALASPDVQLTLVKGGDHRLSTPADLALLVRVVAELRGQLAAGGRRD